MIILFHDLTGEQVVKKTANMANKRAEQISAHLNYPRGMLFGQTAIITGSAQGIGAETARLFANEGARVIVSDIDAGKSPEQRSVCTAHTSPQTNRKPRPTASTKMVDKL